MTDQPIIVTTDELTFEFTPAQAQAIRGYFERRLREQVDAKLLAGFMTPSQARAHLKLEAPPDGAKGCICREYIGGALKIEEDCPTKGRHGPRAQR